MMKTIRNRNKLGTYLAVTAGVGCAASAANAAVVFYGVDAAVPIGINLGSAQQYTVVDSDGSLSSYFRNNGQGSIFSQGSNINGDGYSSAGQYYLQDDFIYGAVAGDQNFANISFNSNDGIFEAVGQFSFDGAGGGFLVAIATTNEITNPLDLSNVGGPALSISEGVALIQAAAVPEPSSLALLALGAAGLISRRQRKAA